MKRASYREGVAWIAFNDDPGSNDARDFESVRHYVSVLLLADLFDKSPDQVATDVVRLRKKSEASK